MSEKSLKTQVAEFYEEFQSHGKYEYLFGDDERKRTLVELIGQGHTILDIGCRSGNLTQYYYEDNRVVGMDVDRNALKLFRERLGLESHWIDVDQDVLPFADASFDLVVFTEVMEHLRFPQHALSEIRRVLKPDGRLIGSVPNAFRLRNRLKFLAGKDFETDPSHLRSYSARRLNNELKSVFSEVTILPVSGHLLGGGKRGVPVFRWLPDGIRRLFCLDLIFIRQGWKRQDSILSRGPALAADGKNERP